MQLLDRLPEIGGHGTTRTPQQSTDIATRKIMNVLYLDLNFICGFAHLPFPHYVTIGVELEGGKVSITSVGAIPVTVGTSRQNESSVHGSCSCFHVVVIGSTILSDASTFDVGKVRN